MTPSIIEIAIASDSNYIVPTTTLLKSLFEHHKTIKLSVNLLHISSMTLEKDLLFLENYVVSHGHNFRKIPVSDNLISVYPELRHSKSTYLRLLLSDILPTNIPKILYLDADTIVNRSLLELYETEISDYYAAAVKETINVYAEHNDNLKQHIKGVGIPSDKFYFGAGVMLMNVDKMRADQITSKYFQFAVDFPEFIRWSDQDVVNGVLHKSIKYIPPKYNFNFYVEPDIVKKLWSKKEIAEARKKTVIIHYIGPVKPWDYLSFHPKTKLWWKYLKLTPFNDFKPKNKSFKNLFKKIYLKISRTLDRNINMSLKMKLGKLVPISLKNKLKSSIGK